MYFFSSAKCLVGVHKNRRGGQGDFENVQVEAIFFSGYLPYCKIGRYEGRIKIGR